jgi:hypothetical protein
VGPAAASAALQLRRRRGWMRQASSPRAPAPLLELRSQAAKTTQVSESAARKKANWLCTGQSVARAYARSGGRWRTWASSARLMTSSPCSAPFRIWLRNFVWVEKPQAGRNRVLRRPDETRRGAWAALNGPGGRRNSLASRPVRIQPSPTQHTF